MNYLEHNGRFTMELTPRKRLFRCYTCEQDYSSGPTLGWHFNTYPNHRTEAQRQKRQENINQRTSRKTIDTHNTSVTKRRAKNDVQAAPTMKRPKHCTQGCGKPILRKWCFCGHCGAPLK